MQSTAMPDIRCNGLTTSHIQEQKDVHVIAVMRKSIFQLDFIIVNILNLICAKCVELQEEDEMTFF